MALDLVILSKCYKLKKFKLPFDNLYVTNKFMQEKEIDENENAKRAIFKP